MKTMPPATRPAQAAPLDGEAARTLEALAAGIAEALAQAQDAGTETRRRELLERASADFERLRGAMDEAADYSALSAFLQSSGEREKASLARELHDQLGGILTPAKMDLAWLRARLGEDPQYGERMARLDALIDQAIDLKRRIIEKLRPSLLDHLGLAAALRWFVEEAAADAGIEAHLDIDAHLGRLPPDVEIACFRLAQEAMANVVAHASAGHVDFTLERAGPGLHMTVSDDGVGIADVGAARRLSRGLAGMGQRARSLGGALEVHSLSGKGTRLEISIPL